MKHRAITFGQRLRESKRVPRLLPAADPNLLTKEEVAAIQGADLVYYPYPIYDDVLRALGKSTYPGNYYHFMGDKIAQTLLFQLLDIPHPRTRIYRTKDKGRILRDFAPPFVAKIPKGSSRGDGVFLIRSEEGLNDYLQKTPAAYIQEYLPIDRDLRVVVLGFRAVHAYWRIAKEGEFRNNVSRGGRISFSDIPEEGLRLAEETAERCGFRELGLDLCLYENRFFVLEANMVFGYKGFEAAGIEVHRVLGEMADRKEL